VLQEFITAAMDRKRALSSETLTRVFSELDDDHDGELGPRVFCTALQVLLASKITLSWGFFSSTGNRQN
jgi:Ca2+-binding EF-hand superfamily protein